MPDVSVSDAISLSEDRLTNILPEWVVQVNIQNEAIEVGGYEVVQPPDAQAVFSIFGEPDLDRIYLVEVKCGREIQGENWTATGSGSYWCSFPPGTYGEVIAVNENDVSYVKATSVGNCDSTTSSFYFDFSTSRLYIHTSTGESPDITEWGSDKFCIISYFWVCFTNRQQESDDFPTTDDRIIFTPPNSSRAQYYLPYLNADNMPSFSQSVGGYHTGDLQIQFGTLTFTNDGWFYWAFENLLWHNAKVNIKMGLLGDAYEDYYPIFCGVCRIPQVGDNEASFDVSDARTNDLAEVPLTVYTEEIFAWIGGSPDESKPIGIPFGFCQGVAPVCIDPAEYIFKVSDYPIQGITAVYENGVELYPPGTVDENGNRIDEYIVWPERGEFGLLQDFEEHIITCDVQGIKCSRSGMYSENFADGCLFILMTLNNIPAEEIDLYAFDQLRNARAQKMGYYIDSITPSLDILRLFQASIVFQLFPGADGRWTVKRYLTDQSDALAISKEEIRELGIKYDTDGVYKKVDVKYKKDPSTGEFLVASAYDNKVKYRYRESKTLEIETALYDGNEAQALANFYLSMVKVPPKTVTLNFGVDGFGKSPTEKVSISKTIIDGDGNLQTVFENEVYRVLEFRKDLGPVVTGLTGLDDSITTGTFHVDVAHSDSHEDSYSDVAHGDIPHSDEAHADVAHSDVAYVDEHTDLYNDYYSGYPIHADHHDGIIHSDGGHWDYVDTPSPPWIPQHSDYSDAHGDTHVDQTSYGDWDVTLYLYHEDTHSDTPHIDSHTDSHGDTAHSDTPYTDIHDQTHGDAPHGDASF